MAENHVRSVVRAFQILERLREAKRPLPLNSLHKDLGIPSSSTAEILKTLWAEGYLSFDTHTKCYFPTAKLGELGEWMMPDVLTQTFSDSSLRELQRRVDAYVVLATPNDIELQYLVLVELDGAITHLNRERGAMPIVYSTMGWALLSVEDDDFNERIYRRLAIAQMIDTKSITLEQFIAHIRDFRREGYVVGRDPESERLAVTTLTPVFYLGRRVAITVSAPADKILPRVEELVKELTPFSVTLGDRGLEATNASALDLARDPLA